MHYALAPSSFLIQGLEKLTNLITFIDPSTSNVAEHDLLWDDIILAFTD
jgi:hypothetical protein